MPSRKVTGGLKRQDTTAHGHALVTGTSIPYLWGWAVSAKARGNYFRLDVPPADFANP